MNRQKVSKGLINLDQYRHVRNALLHVSNNYLDFDINSREKTQISIVSKCWFFCWVSISIEATLDTSSPNINRVFCPFLNDSGKEDSEGHLKNLEILKTF